MATTQLSLIKIRRGLKEQRIKTPFQEGEPLFETDTRRMFIGVGDNIDANLGSETLGGALVSNFTFTANDDPTAQTISRAYNGDLLFANNKIWRYDESVTDNPWVDVSPALSDQLEYNDKNEIAIKTTTLVPNLGLGLSANTQGQISVKVDVNSPVTVTTDGIALTLDSISGKYISSSAFNSNEFEQDGNLNWQLKLDNTYLSSTSEDGITINFVPAGNNSDSVSNGAGTVNAIISSRIQESTVESNGAFGITENNNLKLSDNLTIINSGGQVVGLKPGIISTAFVSSGSTDIFNGAMDDSLATGVSGSTLTIYNAESTDEVSDLNKITATSAGVVILESTGDANGHYLERFAIPIFKLPPAPSVYSLTTAGSTTTIYGNNLETGFVYASDDFGIPTKYPIASLSTDSNGYQVATIDTALSTSNSSTFQTLSGSANLFDETLQIAYVSTPVSGSNLLVTVFNVGTGTPTAVWYDTDGDSHDFTVTMSTSAGASSSARILTLSGFSSSAGDISSLQIATADGLQIAYHSFS